MTRDDFPKDVLDALARRVNLRCSMPGCRQGTTGPRTDPARSVCVGVAAHITAASVGGPRYDASLTSAQRRSAENGIWLCQNHAKLVDNDASRYTADELRAWKRDEEAQALAELEGKGSAAVSGLGLELSFKKVSHSPAMYPTRHDYLLRVSVRNGGTDRVSGYHVDLELPAVVLELERAEVKVLHVPARSNHRKALLRMSGPELYPGDACDAFALPYFVDDKIFDNRAKVFQQPVKATLYCPGFPVLSTEKLFDELQNF
jgi:hypothetical protein